MDKPNNKATNSKFNKKAREFVSYLIGKSIDLGLGAISKTILGVNINQDIVQKGIKEHQKVSHWKIFFEVRRISRRENLTPNEMSTLYRKLSILNTINFGILKGEIISNFLRKRTR